MRQGGVRSGIRCTLPAGNDRSAFLGQTGVGPALPSPELACGGSEEKKTRTASKAGEGVPGLLGCATFAALDVVKRVQGIFWKQDMMRAL